MVHEHGNHSEQKEFFMKGYNEMLKRIKPSKIICYSEPFAEMEGDIIYVDYELSSWKYLKSESDVLNTKCKSGRIIHPKVVARALNKGTFKGDYAEEYKQAVVYLGRMTIPNNAEYAFYYFVTTHKAYYEGSFWYQLTHREPYYYFYNPIS